MYHLLYLKAQTIRQVILQLSGPHNMNFISEERLNQLMADELDFLFIMDMDGKILFTNIATHSLLGYGNEIVGCNFISLYLPQHREEVGVMFPLAAKGDVEHCPFPLQKKGRGVVPVDTKFYVGWWNEENVLVAVATNLSAHHFTQEEFYHIFNSAEIMMVLASTDGRYIYNANRTFRKASGYTIEELSGQELTDIGLFLNEERYRRIMVRYAKTGTAKGEATVRTKPGELMTCLFSIENIKINDKDYLFAVATDITERKQVETKMRYLLYQQKLLADVAQLFNTTDDFNDTINKVLHLVGTHSGVSRINITKVIDDGKYYSTIYEWCAEGISPLIELTKRVSVDSIPDWSKQLSELGSVLIDFKNVTDISDDLKSFLQQIGVKSVLAYPLYVQNIFWGFIAFDDCVRCKVWQPEERHLMHVISSNIASALDRKAYIEQYTNSELRLRMPLPGATEGMWDRNPITDEVYFTDSCFTMLGFDAGEVEPTSRHWNELVHPDDWPLAQKAFAEHRLGGTEFYEIVFRVRTKDGGWKWILDHGKIVESDVNGVPTRAVGTHIDMTQQKETEHKLQELLTTKDKLFSIISHDLRGPIGSFMQVIELLTSDVEIAPEMQAELLNELKSMSRNTYYLLENLLNWSRSQRSEIEYAPRMILVNDVVTENISLLKGTALQKDIILKFDTEVYVNAFADYNMVNLILRNLLSNAIKFTPQGGVIEVLLTHDDEWVAVTVKDSGVGMSQEVVEKLFERDHYHSTYGTNNEKGSGLGLMLCSDFVKRNGGSLRVESQLGKGSSFIFTLPLHGIPEGESLVL